MSNKNNKNVIDELADCLDIPESAYKKAEARYKDLGDWFSRADAHCADYGPHIYPQGSFRLGTVVNGDEYDLDIGCRLTEGVSKRSHTQAQLKELVRLDLDEYRVARRMENDLEEKNRCWRLQYKDEIAFHMDVVPSIPEEQPLRDSMRTAMVEFGVGFDLAASIVQLSGSITDRKLPFFNLINPNWKVSNSEGYANWFESRVKLAEEPLQRRSAEFKAAKIDDLPASKWKSPLQRSIQILKCHRDRMFEDCPDKKPISIILTTLAAEAYEGEESISDALEGILTKMGDFVRADKPRIPNPVNPVEDFADKWYDREYNHLDLEGNFWSWLAQARADFNHIRDSREPAKIRQQAMVKFGASLNEDRIRDAVASAAMVAESVPKVHVISGTPAQPWLRS